MCPGGGGLLVRTAMVDPVRTARASASAARKSTCLGVRSPARERPNDEGPDHETVGQGPLLWWSGPASIR
jgi:hypothetical protein